MVLVDSNVLIDVCQRDPHWFEWSARQLAAAAEREPLAVNPIIYAEVSPCFDSHADLERMLPPSVYKRLELPYEAGYLAGQAFALYRRKGGQRSVPLPDFYIGAHAVTQNLTLLTRDVSRYRTYFPKIKLIAPEA